MPDKFQPEDRVFAKIKGWPPWPAKVMSRVEGKIESYMILFYGTYDTSTVKPDSLFPYSEETKAKYGKPKNKNRWKEAMEEIENNIPVGETGRLQGKDTPAENNDTDGDGDLRIDEGLPPVLTKESKTPAPNQNGKAEPPPATKVSGRRGSKASSKRDSISSTSSLPEKSTPAANAATPGTEMVSRSGRKIKPKRFADDEISTTRTPTKTKASSQDESSEGPPSKRAKRGGKTAKSSPVPEPKESTPVTRPRVVIGKGKPATPPTPKVASGRLSPDIMAGAAPTLKPAVVVTQRKPDAPPPPPPPPLPAAAGRAMTLQQQQTHAIQQEIPTRRAPRHEIVADEEVASPPSMLSGDDEAETDDKENLNEGAPSSSGSEDLESESEMDKNFEVEEAFAEANDESLMKIRFTDKEGEAFEIRMEQKESFENEEEKLDYENTVQTAVKLKEELEAGDQETHETLQDVMETNRDDDSEDAITRERRAAQIRTLKIEGEVIEIIGEIVSCLGEHQAEVGRAYELLERLSTHELSALILKKHPEVVYTVSRMRKYVGNVNQWNLSAEPGNDFRELAELIRIKAAEIYDSFYAVFIPREEQDDSVTFEEIYKEEMKVFQELTQGYSMDEVLGLTAELENGRFEMFELAQNED